MNVLKTIQSIEDRKREQHRYPEFALFREIHDEMPELSTDQLQKELRKLITNRQIEWGDTLNDTYFKTTSL